MQRYQGKSLCFGLSEELSEQVRELSRREGVTVFMTLLAAYYILLHKYSGQENIVVGTDITNRTHVETERLIGCFFNLLPLRADLSGAPSFGRCSGGCVRWRWAHTPIRDCRLKSCWRIYPSARPRSHVLSRRYSFCVTRPARE